MKETKKEKRKKERKRQDRESERRETKRVRRDATPHTTPMRERPTLLPVPTLPSAVTYLNQKRSHQRCHVRPILPLLPNA